METLLWAPKKGPVSAGQEPVRWTFLAGGPGGAQSRPGREQRGGGLGASKRGAARARARGCGPGASKGGGGLGASQGGCGLGASKRGAARARAMVGAARARAAWTIQIGQVWENLSNLAPYISMAI